MSQSTAKQGKTACLYSRDSDKFGRPPSKIRALWFTALKRLLLWISKNELLISKNRKYIVKRRATGIYCKLSHRTDPLRISMNKTETVHLVHRIFLCVLKCIRLSVSTIKSYHCFIFFYQWHVHFILGSNVD